MVNVRKLRWALAALLIGAAFTGRADDCFSAVRAVSQPAVFPNLAAGPVALGGSIFGVAKNASDGTRGIAFSTYDLDFNRLTSDRVVANASYERALALLWTGSEFGLFYRDPGARLVLQRLAVTGEQLGGPIPIAPQHTTWNDNEYAITWDPVRKLYLVVQTITQGGDHGLWFFGVAADGALKVDLLVSFFFARNATPQVAVTKAGTIGIVWGYVDSLSGGATLTFLTIDGRNVYSVANQFAINAFTPRIGVNDSAAPPTGSTADPSQFAIVWSTADTRVVPVPPAPQPTELHWARASASGSIIAGERRLINSRGVDAAPVALLWNPARSEWALSYLDGALGFRVFPPSLRLLRFGNDGTIFGDAFFSPDATKSLLSTPYPFVNTGRGYVSSIERLLSPAEGSESYLVSNCPLTPVITVSNAYPAPGSVVTFDTNSTGGSGPVTYVYDFGDFSQLARTKSPQHTFVFAGDYTVTVTATDASGGVAVTTFVVHAGGTPPVVPCGAPTPVPIISAPIVDFPIAVPGSPITFTTGFAPQSGVTYRWNFGDGTPAADGDRVTHQYAAAGTYNVSYTRIYLTPPPCGGGGSVSGSTQIRVVNLRRRAK